MRVPVLLLIAGLLAAGCVSAPLDTPPGTDAGAPSTDVRLPAMGITFHSIGNQGALHSLHLAEGPDAKLTFPEGVLVQDEAGRLLPATEPVAVASGGYVFYLPPYGVDAVTVKVDAAGASEEMHLVLPEGPALFNGDLVVDLLKIQRDQFPHRSPGNPSYGEAIAYFVEFFEALNYTVEVQRYEGGNLPVGNVAPDSLSNVVAYKPGTSSRILAFGGHFDVVEETRDGAFDNTAGTVATMAVAQAFANVTTEHTLMFGLWGGEEDGILGSQWWVTTHPDKLPLIDAYVNFDVTGIAWPAPKPDPAPVVVAAGPDGPIADALHAQAAEIESKWLMSGAKFVMEGVAQGQATGAGVNAQSDHTPFMARGVPVYFQFTQRVGDVFAIIHSDVDTVDNLTKYALLGVEGMGDDVVLTPDEVEEGEWYLARSFETQMGLAFYYALLVDGGILPVARGLPVEPPVTGVDLPLVE